MMMLLQLSKIILKAYMLLLTVAAGGFVGANFIAVLAGALTFGGPKVPETESIQWWMHCGWVAGAGLFFV